MRTTFDGQEGVNVIVDRRYGERRLTEQPLAVERRGADRRSEGEDLGWDVGYTAIADMLWTAVIRSHEPDNYVTAMTEHILNGIPDISTRMLAADRIRQAVGVDISTELVTRDG